MNEKKRTYEGMFLLDSGNTDFNAASEPIRNVLARYEAETLSIKPWDDRKLIYEILGRKRGLYVLTYFKADPTKVREIEHDCQLDERILRALFLRREDLTAEQINAATPATGAPPKEPPPAPAGSEVRAAADVAAAGAIPKAIEGIEANNNLVEDDKDAPQG